PARWRAAFSPRCPIRYVRARNRVMRLRALLLVLLVACRAPTTSIAVGDVVAIDAASAWVLVRLGGATGTPRRSQSTGAVVAEGRAEVSAESRRGPRARAELGGTSAGGVEALPGGRPGVPELTPHHGGVVSMVGAQHIEVAALADGGVRVYLSGLAGQPLPVD